MAGRGPAPKPQRIRPTDNKARQSEFKLLTSDDVVRGPELPEGDIDWPPRTRALWHALRTSPMAATWLDVDWQSLLDLADLHRRFVAGDVKLAGEIRLRLGQYGVSPEARLRLRLLVDNGEPEVESKLEALRRRQAANSIAPGAPRRRRLMNAVTETPTSKENR